MYVLVLPFMCRSEPESSSLPCTFARVILILFFQLILQRQLSSFCWGNWRLFFSPYPCPALLCQWYLFWWLSLIMSISFFGHLHVAVLHKATVEVKQRKVHMQKTTYCILSLTSFLASHTFSQDYLFFRKISGWYHWCIYHTCSFNCSEFLGHCIHWKSTILWSYFQAHIDIIGALMLLFLLLICARMLGNSFSTCHSLCSNLEKILHDRKRK